MELVANFFEVNAKFGAKPPMRQAILKGLLKFTEQYVKDNPAIKSFYMNPLTYGWNETDLNAYPLQTKNITEKLGGPYLPDGDSSGPASTDQVYYLQSLKSTQFRQFDSMILANDKSQIVDIQESIIDSTLSILREEKLNDSELMTKLIDKHRIEWEGVFGETLDSSNIKFYPFISNIINNVKSSLALNEDISSTTASATSGLWEQSVTSTTTTTLSSAAESTMNSSQKAIK